MPHPFFEALTYPWKREDARALHGALYKVIDEPAAIKLLYKSAGGENPLTPADALAMWQEALDALTAARGLEQLCNLLLEKPAWKAIHSIVRSVQSAEDPLDEVVLSRTHVFIDREPLRDKLQQLARNPSIRVLLVRGAPKSGKSWTKHMIVNVAGSLGEPCIYLDQDLVIDLDGALSLLFASTGGASASPPPATTTEDAWFKSICYKLLAYAKGGRTSWIVVDDLGTDEHGPRLDPRIRSFFDQFALQMKNPEFAKWFRLVLIDYPEAGGGSGRGVPTKWEAFWVEDRPDTADVNTEALKTFVTRWAIAEKKQLGGNDAEKFAHDVIVAAEAAIVAAEAAGNAPASRLQHIHEAVVSALPGL